LVGLPADTAHACGIGSPWREHIDVGQLVSFLDPSMAGFRSTNVFQKLKQILAAFAIEGAGRSSQILELPQPGDYRASCRESARVARDVRKTSPSSTRRVSLSRH